MAIDAQTLMGEGRYQAAIEKLNAALALSELSAYETSALHQMRAVCFYETDQNKAAILDFEKSLNAGGLTTNDHSQVNLALAQLLIAEGQSRRGAMMLEGWIKAGGKPSSAHLQLIIQAWNETGKHDRALPWAQRWFDDANPKDRKHFDLLNHLYFKLSRPGDQAAIVKQMIERWPDDKQLWEQWISLLSMVDRIQDAFEVRMQMYRRGMIEEEPELLKLAQYHSYYDIPYWGAKLLETEMNAGRVQPSQANLETLSNYWRQAREYERAIPVLEKAIEGSSDSRLHAALGEAYYNRGACDKAQSAFSRAMDFGYDPGKSRMLVATCIYEKSQAEERPSCAATTRSDREASAKFQLQTKALSAFDNVPASSPQRRKADKWISFIRAEQKTLEDRCVFIQEQEWLRCAQEIHRAYENYFTTGTLDISEACIPYKQRYDQEHRQGREIINLEN